MFTTAHYNLIMAMHVAGGNTRTAAELLNITRRSLWRQNREIIKLYGLDLRVASDRTQMFQEAKKDFLLPCPRCGKTDLEIRSIHSAGTDCYEPHYTGLIICKNCNYRLWAHHQTDWQQAVDHAAFIWNERGGAK